MLRQSIAAAIVALVAGGAWAQQAPDGWYVGVFGSVSTQPLVGDHSDASALPFVSYRTEQFSLGFDGASYTAFEQNGQSLDLLLRPRFPLIDEDEPEFAGMSRDIGLDLGAAFAIETGQGFEISVTALQGLTEEQQGQEIDLQFSQQLGQLPVSVYAGATWQSDQLTEYLYGVRPGEAAGGRPAYAPGGAVTPYIGVQGFLPVSDRAALIGTVEAMQFPDAITDSPIVEDDGVVTARMGVVFNF